MTRNGARIVFAPSSRSRHLGDLPQPLRYLGGSSNGRTADSGSAYQGSNPCPPAERLCYSAPLVSPCVASGPHRLAVRTPASHVGNTGSIPVGVADFPSENGKIAEGRRRFANAPRAMVGTSRGCGARCSRWHVALRELVERARAQATDRDETRARSERRRRHAPPQRPGSHIPANRAGTRTSWAFIASQPSRKRPSPSSLPSSDPSW